MSNQPQTRTKDQVVQDYNNVIFRAGNVQYQIKTLENDLRLLNETALKLNLEHAELSKIEKAAAELTAKAAAEAAPKLAPSEGAPANA